MSTFIGNDFLSKQAKIASLQEQIKEARISARNASIYAVVLLVLTGAMFGFYSSSSGDWVSLSLGIFLAIVALISLINEWTRNKTKKKLMMELDAMSVKIPTCPKCGKQIPQGNYPFCPSCGSALDRK